MKPDLNKTKIITKLKNRILPLLCSAPFRWVPFLRANERNTTSYPLLASSETRLLFSSARKRRGRDTATEGATVEQLTGRPSQERREEGLEVRMEEVWGLEGGGGQGLVVRGHKGPAGAEVPELCKACWEYLKAQS